MVLPYSVVLALAILLQQLALAFVPDLALGAEVFAVIVGYILAQLGIEVVGAPLAFYLVRKFPRLAPLANRLYAFGYEDN